jgi:hypothetical protein
MTRSKSSIRASAIARRTLALPVRSRCGTLGAAISARLCIAASSILLLLALSGPAAADTFAVDRADDDAASTCSAAANDCTLRGAINDANATTDPDTITIPAIRISVRADLPDIAQPLTITGAGARKSIIDGTGSVGTVLSGAMTLQDLEVTGAKAPAADDPLSGTAAVSSFTGGLLERVAIVDNQSVGLNASGSTILDSLIARNTGHGSGGITAEQVDVLRNSTVTDNVAVPGGTSGFVLGAGVTNVGGLIAIEDTTIAGNRVAGGAAVLTGVNLGSLAQLTPSVLLRSSIIADGAGENCGGPIESQGHNIDSDGSCRFAGPGDRSSVDPQLGPLADNGGPTDTKALLKGSPAIDAGAGCLATDQRGQPRPMGGGCDAGAFESPFTAPLAATTGPTAPIPPQPATTPPTATAQVPSLDRTPPTLTIRGIARTMTRKALRAGLKVHVAANEPITADIALLIAPRRVTIASAPDLTLATRTLPRGTGNRIVALKPRRKLTGSRPIRAELIVIAYDDAGNRTAKTINFTIK